MNKFDLAQLTAYFVSQDIPADSRLVIVGLVLSGSMLALGLITPVALVLLQRFKRLPASHRFIRSVANVLRIGGLLWLILFFLRYESIFPFRMRIWVYALLIPFIAVIAVLWRNYRRELPKVKQASVLKDRYERFLPRPKAR